MSTSNDKFIQEMYKIVKFKNPNMLPLFTQKINNDYITRNQCHLKLCPKMINGIEKLKELGEIDYIIIEPHSYCTYKYKDTDEVHQKRLCKNEKCNYAHTKDELRKPICILNLFNCCDKTSKCCKYKHTKDESGLPNILLCSKKYINEVGDQIFKCFYYTDSVQIYFYETKETIFLNIKNKEERDQLYHSLIKMN